jgi:uncharacterized protein YndB with AHSA1/START domain
MRRFAVCLIVLLAAAQSLRAEERVLRNEIVIRSSLEKAWSALTTAEGMKAWNVHDAVIEMKLMGRYHTHYTGVVGDVGTVTNTILMYIPNRMYAFKVGFPGNFAVPDGTGKRVPVPEVLSAGTIFAVVEIEDVGKGDIRASVTMPGYQSGREWDLVYDFFKKGNDTELQALKKFLETH